MGRVIGVIPARLASTRLPRKVLRNICGQPMISWVCRAAMACPELDAVIVATDSDEVFRWCRSAGFNVRMTPEDLPSGTDRVHSVALDEKADVYVNIQGDEPLLRPQHISAMLKLLREKHVEVATLKVAASMMDAAAPNVVKVVTALDGRALYFSRASVPFYRDGHGGPCFKHLGLYAYRRAALERFASLAPTPLEQAERLEQLRMLENGMAIYVAETEFDTIGVDTLADLEAVSEVLKARGKCAT
jgi:3-deoxy-manno-octulosonate cytidylyltransferase (CMP-KDO synthetase)